MPRYIDIDALWRDVTSNIEDCGDVLEIIERQPVVTINDIADENKVTNCNHNAEVGKMVSSSCGHENGKDVIYRQDAIDQIQAIESLATLPDNDAVIRMNDIEKILYNLPSAQPEIKPIDYQDCANAMMKMWMDNVLTDGEYNRIMDKLNKHEMERRKADERSDL